MKIRISVVVCLVLVSIGSIVFAQKRHEIKFASIAPPGTTPDRIMNSLNDELQNRTNGRLRIKNYANSQGDESDIIRKMNPRIGRLHAAGLTGRGLGEILPMIRVLEVPFLFRNYDEIDYVIDKLYGRFAYEFEKKGYVLLGWAEVGFVYIFSKDRLQTREELKQSKMWAWSGDPLAYEMFRELGVTPIPLALPDALTSLQTGLINGVYTHPYGALALSWFERTNYMSTLPITFATGAVVITKKKFDELEPELQEILLKTSKKWLDELVKQTRKDNENAMEILRQRNINFVPKPEGENLQVFLSAGINVRNKLVGKLYPQELLDQVLAFLQKFRSN